jgi:hypothetical protein
MKAVTALWPNLPVLLAGSAIVGVGWMITQALPGWIAVVGFGLLVLPPLAALTDGCRMLIKDEHFGMAALFRSLPRTYAVTIKIIFIPMIMTVLTTLTVGLWQQTGRGWLLPSVVVGCLVCAASIFVAVVAVPYALAGRSTVKHTWLVSAYLASRHPIAVLSTISAVVLLGLVVEHLSFALIILFPGPLAMLWASGLTSAISRGQESLALKGSR